jgi:hypothetical protein
LYAGQLAKIMPLILNVFPAVALYYSMRYIHTFPPCILKAQWLATAFTTWTSNFTGQHTLYAGAVEGVESFHCSWEASSSGTAVHPLMAPFLHTEQY